MDAPFTIEHIKDRNYLKVRVLAPVTRELADKFSQGAEKECEQLECCGYLVDTRGFPNVSSVNDNVEFSAWDMKVTGAQAEMKRAILIDVDDDTHDLPILAMREMGFNVEKFTDEQEAIAWVIGTS
jgi:hypothetical protein